jgi:hypothetical protein
VAPRWGVCATVKAPLAQVAAFAAHHLELGAHRVWLHFDDPADPAADALEGRRRISVIRCDAAYWERLCKARPPTHQLRQMRNITRVTRRTDMDFVAHFDADEFLLADAPVEAALAGVPADHLILRVEPWEALHDPARPGPLAARHFRRAVPAGDAALRTALYGPHAAVLPRGMISHTVGKCFFRTRVPGMVANIHGARIAGERVPGGPFCPDLALLHFHADDPARWKAGLAFRLTKGAYQFMPALQAYLAGASAPEIDDFYLRVQTATPAMLAALAGAGLLRVADPGLADKAARLLA